MLRRNIPIFARPKVAGHILLSRGFSNGPNAETNSGKAPVDPEKARQEAAKLAMQSVKDIGSLFSSSSEDKTQPIDTRPVFEDPTLFGSLSLLHQGQVLKELQDKYDKKWHKLTDKDKYLGYYIAYGDWGVREEFKNWNTMEPPLDLPFKTPSSIKSTTPTSTTPVKRIEPVILSETPVRLKQFDVKKMDGVTKFFIYLTAFITVFAIARDKKVGEEGKPKEVVILDKYEMERQRKLKHDEQAARQQQDEAAKQALARSQNRKWYYLWLK